KYTEEASLGLVWRRHERRINDGSKSAWVYAQAATAQRPSTTISGGTSSTRMRWRPGKMLISAHCTCWPFGSAVPTPLAEKKATRASVEELGRRNRTAADVRVVSARGVLRWSARRCTRASDACSRG